MATKNYIHDEIIGNVSYNNFWIFIGQDLLLFPLIDN
jgi:hypothetical protein